MTLLPKGSIPLPDGVPVVRADRFARLLDQLGAREAPAGMNGTDRHGRFALQATRATGGVRELARTSSLKRCEVIAESYLKLENEWRIDCVYDLDTLAGPEPGLQVGDEVLSDDGERWLRVEMIDRASHARRATLHTTDGFLFEDETDEDGGVRRNTPDPRQPVRHDIAVMRTIVVFNTVPTP